MTGISLTNKRIRVSLLWVTRKYETITNCASLSLSLILWETVLFSIKGVHLEKNFHRAEQHPLILDRKCVFYTWSWNMFTVILYIIYKRKDVGFTSTVVQIDFISWKEYYVTLGTTESTQNQWIWLEEFE